MVTRHYLFTVTSKCSRPCCQPIGLRYQRLTLSLKPWSPRTIDETLKHCWDLEHKLTGELDTNRNPSIWLKKLFIPFGCRWFQLCSRVNLPLEKFFALFLRGADQYSEWWIHQFLVVYRAMEIFCNYTQGLWYSDTWFGQIPQRHKLLLSIWELPLFLRNFEETY